MTAHWTRVDSIEIKCRRRDILYIVAGRRAGNVDSVINRSRREIHVTEKTETRDRMGTGAGSEAGIIQRPEVSSFQHSAGGVDVGIGDLEYLRADRERERQERIQLRTDYGAKAGRKTWHRQVPGSTIQQGGVELAWEGEVGGKIAERRGGPTPSPAREIPTRIPPPPFDLSGYSCASQDAHALCPAAATLFASFRRVPPGVPHAHTLGDVPSSHRVESPLGDAPLARPRGFNTMHGRYPSALNHPSVTHTQPAAPAFSLQPCTHAHHAASVLLHRVVHAFSSCGRANVLLPDPPCTVNRSRPALRGSSIFTAPALACCHPRRAAFPSPTLVLGAPKFGPQSRRRRLAHRARSQEPLLASTPCERPSQYTSPLTRSTSTQYPLSDIRSPAVIPAHRSCPGHFPSSRPPLLQRGFQYRYRYSADSPQPASFPGAPCPGHFPSSRPPLLQRGFQYRYRYSADSPQPASFPGAPSDTRPCHPIRTCDLVPPMHRVGRETLPSSISPTKRERATAVPPADDPSHSPGSDGRGRVVTILDERHASP
ncbi:hypothetical protein C8R44DRAFT_736481 [Mycena epipterygia]|nr:hypothetical protein C8R44DRAFT_736481 [Mycena epipterygia]